MVIRRGPARPRDVDVERLARLNVWCRCAVPVFRPNAAQRTGWRILVCQQCQGLQRPAQH